MMIRPVRRLLPAWVSCIWILLLIVSSVNSACYAMWVAPQVAYRETITKHVKVEGRFVRQTGGRGQYGHVWLEIEPERTR